MSKRTQIMNPPTEPRNLLFNINRPRDESGLPHDSISLSRANELSSLDVLLRTREELINMSMGSSSSMNSYPSERNLNTSLINPDRQFLGSISSSDVVGSGNRQLQQEQQQSRLFYENMAIGSFRNSTNQSSPHFTQPSLCSSINQFSTFGSHSSHIDSSLLLQNKNLSSLPNCNEAGGSPIFSNQLLQEVNYHLQLQQQNLDFRKSQLERAGLNSVPLSLESYQNKSSSGLSPQCGSSSGLNLSTVSLDTNRVPEINTGVPDLIFTNSSIAGIVSSRSTSDKSTHNGKVLFFPCRARGMEQAHNFESAYFTIPDDLDHGADLYCSYPACRTEGCKFRYCATCKAPAARRNFRKRHGNCGKSDNKQKKKELIEISPKFMDKKGISVVTHKSTEPAGAIEESSYARSNSSKSSKVRPRPDDSDGERSTDDLNECWDKLLKARPDASKKSSMDAWMQKVTALSERRNHRKAKETL